ncbi:hypothetical protein J437_LFUL007761, partial [Ladona fulva]
MKALRLSKIKQRDLRLSKITDYIHLDSDFNSCFLTHNINERATFLCPSRRSIGGSIDGTDIFMSMMLKIRVYFQTLGSWEDFG